MSKIILTLITTTLLIGCGGRYVRPYQPYNYGYTPMQPNDVYLRPCYTYRGGC